MLSEMSDRQLLKGHAAFETANRVLADALPPIERCWWYGSRLDGTDGTGLVLRFQRHQAAIGLL